MKKQNPSPSTACTVEKTSENESEVKVIVTKHTIFIRFYLDEPPQPSTTLHTKDMGIMCKNLLLKDIRAFQKV